MGNKSAKKANSEQFASIQHGFSFAVFSTPDWPHHESESIFGSRIGPMPGETLLDSNHL